MLRSVFFRTNNGYAKAIIDEKHIDLFVEMGAVLTQVEALVPKEVKKTEAKPEPEPESESKQEIKKTLEGDLGSGELGSERFHTLHIAELEDFDDIRNYVKKVTGKTILKSKKSTVETFKKKAITTIKRFLKNGNQSG